MSLIVGCTTSGGLDILNAGERAGVRREYICSSFGLCELTGVSVIPLTFNSLLFDTALATKS